MKESGYVVAVVGAARVVGREVCAALRERHFPISAWRLFDTADRAIAADEAEWEEPMLGLDRLDLSGVDIVFLCATEALSAEWAPRAAEQGVLVVDLTHAFGDRLDVPLIVPEVNAAAAADAGTLLATPVPGATALSVVLKPLDEVAQIRRVVATGCESVASADHEGIEELVQQTRDLLSGRSPDVAVFPHRVAFNLIPQVGDFVAAGKTRGEWQIESQVRRLLDLPELPITVTSVRVPAFFGLGYSVNIETERPLDADAARAVLRAAPGIVLLDDVDAQAYPTLIEAVETDATFVGRVRDDATVPYGLNLWLAIDGVRKGAAVNAVQIAELMIRGDR